MALRGLKPDKVPPIATAEFFRAFLKVWQPTPNPRGGFQPAKIGLAVSGGGDSMALAFLCQQLVKERLASYLTFEAFIVDHNARPGSGEEAQRVSAWLRDLGIKSHILTLRWPQDKPPSAMSNFETQARTLRYQALGMACRDNDMRSLFFGHHQGDQVETVLIRLASWRIGFGLRGIRPKGRIPLCGGVFGVYESGDSRFSLGSTIEKGSQTSWNNQDSTSSAISDSGIYVFRPFLSYQKAHLLSTCLYYKVPFVSDPTNFEPKHTIRNAVRYMIANHVFPRALQTSSILSLSDAAQGAQENLKRQSDLLLSSSRMVDFDLRSGRLVVRIPSSVAKFDVSSQYRGTRSRFDPAHDRNLQPYARCIRALIGLISHARDGTSVNLASLVPGVLTLFPELVTESSDEVMFKKRGRFTAGGVLFEWLVPLNPQGKCQESACSTWNEETSKQEHLDKGTDAWQLTRRPFESQKSRNKRLTVSSPSSVTHDRDADGNRWSDWHFWDNRFWICINFSLLQPSSISQLFILRHLEEGDLPFIRKRLDKERFKKFQQQLAVAAPGKSRFTLPVIAEPNESGSISLVRAVPTFGIEIPPKGELPSTEVLGSNGPKWQVRFKAFHRGTVELARGNVTNEDGVLIKHREEGPQESR